MSQNIAPFLVQFSIHFLGSSGGSVVQNLSANAGDAGLISLGQKDPFGAGNGNPTPEVLTSKSHGHRSLAGCSPWSCKRVGHDLETKQQKSTSYGYLSQKYLYLS